MGHQTSSDSGEVKTFKKNKDIFVVLCTMGFNNISTARSALMFSSIAAAAELKTIMFCVQEGVDIMVKGAAEKEPVKPGVPTLKQRLEEAMDMGVEIHCCSQSMNNKKLAIDDMIDGVKITGAATLIDLVLDAKGCLCF